MKKDATKAQKPNSQKKRGQWIDVWRRLLRSKLAVFGMILVILVILSAIFADLLTPYDPAQVDFGNRFAMPSLAHPLGTDNFGRDLLCRILYGGRVSLLVAIVSVIIAQLIGGFLGLTAGYFGGKYETVVMRIIDIVMAIPGLLLAVVISAALGTGLFNTALAIGLSSITGGARIFRAETMTIRDQEYIEAARANGATRRHIIMKHVLPNTVAPVIVDTTLKVGMAILQISSLSFIGLGVQEPTAEWGSILNAGRAYIRDFWPLVVFPGMAIVITLVGFNLLGDGLRDALDPKLKR